MACEPASRGLAPSGRSPHACQRCLAPVNLHPIALRRRSFTRLAQSLAALNAPLQAAIATGSHAAVAQFKAASCVLISAATLCRHVELGPAVGAQLGSATCILFGSGRCLLDAARSTPAVRRVLQGGLGSAGAALEATTQMQAVAELEAMLRAQAAVYARAFAPERVLPWLAALTEFLLSLGDSPAGELPGGILLAHLPAWLTSQKPRRAAR